MQNATKIREEPANSMAISRSYKVDFFGLPCLNHLPFQNMIVIELAVGAMMGIDINILIFIANSRLFSMF
jgi:hypothetical protein